MFQKLLIEGLTDALGFIGGAFLAYGLTNLFGLDIFAAGYGNATMAGIVMVGIGGGVGLQVARRLRARRSGTGPGQEG